MLDQSTIHEANSDGSNGAKPSQTCTLAEYITNNGAIHWRNLLRAFFDLSFALETRLSDPASPHGAINMSTLQLRDSGTESDIVINPSPQLQASDAATTSGTTASAGAVPKTGVQENGLFFNECYMSPEECLTQKLDNRSDIYSVGCIMYHCLTGAPPFMHSNREHLKEMQVIEYPLAPGRRFQRIRIPDEVDQLVLKCLEKDPARRFQNAKEFRAEIGKTLQLEDRSDEFYRITDKDRKIFFTVCAVVAVLILAGAGIYSLVSSEDFNNVVRRTSERQRKRYFLSVEAGPLFLKQLDFKYHSPRPDREPLELTQKGGEIVLFATTLKNSIKDAIKEAIHRKLLLAAIDLEKQDLSGAELQGGAMPSAFLSGARLDGANLSAAQLKQSTCIGTSFKNAKLKGCTLLQANLSKAIFDDANLDSAVLINADLSGASFKNADLENALLLGAKLEGADFSNANLAGATFGKKNLKEAALSEQQLKQIHTIAD